MGERLKGKNAVVTGSGRGIGREVVLALVAEGANVVVCDPGVARDGSDSSKAPADEVVEEIKKRGGKAIANYESVTDFAAAERLVKSCVDNFGRLDILVNCAGILRERMIFNMAEEEWDAVINVHLKGTFNCCRHACAIMKQQQSGRIINTTSDAWLGSPGQANYGAAKGGIVSLTRTIAREMARHGVTCNAIAPLASTRMTLDDSLKATLQKRYESGAITKEQMNRMLSMPGPQYIPPIALYLATDEAANINGKVIGCGGGRIALYSEPKEIKAIYKDYEKDGPWTLDELIRLIPRSIALEMVKPPSPEPPKTNK
ncbi:SDR family NAD(P)-dependent oxidoreductase [Chloroflexota bacterium]